MEDGRTNVRTTLDINEMLRNAEKYRKEMANMGVVTDKEGKLISTAWQRIGEAVKNTEVNGALREMTGRMSENIALQKKLLHDLEQQYEEVEKTLENTLPGLAKISLQAEMASIKKEIEGEKQAFAELEQIRQKYGVQNTLPATSLMGRDREQGEAEKQKYRGSNRGKEQTENSSNLVNQKPGFSQWEGFISGIEGVAGGFTAVNELMGLFISDNEKLADVQSRLQSVLAITIGMQQFSNTLYETSAFRMTLVKRVAELYTAAQNKLAVSLGISTFAAKAFMATLTLGVSAAVTAVIALISRWQSTQHKAAEEQEHIVKVQKRSAESLGEQLTIYKKLQKEWEDLGGTLEVKKRYIEANRSEFDKLGITIENVNDAEKLFVANKDAFIASLDQRAKAMAAMELAREKYKEAMSKKREADVLRESQSVTKNIKRGGVSFLHTEWKDSESSKEYRKLIEEAKKAEQSGGSYIKKHSVFSKASLNTLEKAGLKPKDGDKGKEQRKEEARLKAEQLKKQAEEEKKIYERIQEELRTLEKQNQQSRIDLMQEGSKKEIAQINLDYQEKIKRIKKLADQWAEEQGGTLNAAQTVQITEAYSNAKKARETGITGLQEKEVKEEMEAWDEYIKEYGKYEEKKLIITRQYTKKIAEAKNPAEKALLQKQQEKELDTLNRSMIEKTDLWNRLFSAADKHTNKYIKETIGKTQKLLDYIKGEKNVGKPEDFTADQIESLKKDPAKVEAILKQLNQQKDELDSRNPFKGLINGFKDLANAGDDTEKQMVAVNKILKGMNGASAIIGKVGGALDAMGIKAGSALQEVSGVINDTVSMASTGASLGGPIGAAVGAGLGLATSVIKLFSEKKEKRKEKRIAEIQKQIKGLDKEYAKLQQQTSSSYSGKKAKLIQEESRNLDSQNKLMQQQIMEEQAKKKTDPGKIEEWNAAIEANNEKIKENGRLMIDAIAGSDIQSAIDNFSQMYADAWAVGNDRAKASKDLVKKMIKEMIVEAMKMDIEAPLQHIREQMVGFYEDGIIDLYEQNQLEKMAENITHELDRKYLWADRFMKNDEVSSPAVSSGVVSDKITEETAGELTGLWRGSYDTLKGMDRKMTNFQESYKYTMTLCNLILNRIASNTGTSALNTTAMLSELKSLRVDVQSLKDTRKFV